MSIEKTSTELPAYIKNCLKQGFKEDQIRAKLLKAGMSIEEIVSILAPKTGYCHNLIRRISDAGKETLEARKAKVQRASENTIKIQPVYNMQGKLVEYDKYGRHINIKV